MRSEDQYAYDVEGMTCCCAKGRCGDGHSGCYYEALTQQKRKQARNEYSSTSGGNNEKDVISRHENR